MNSVYSQNDWRLYHGIDGVQNLVSDTHPVQDPHKYGLPKLKKYPMPDAQHVRSAIKFFNYVSPENEKELARAILRRMKEYGVDDIEIGPNNRFGKYYSGGSLKHHGIKGQQWGVRNGPPYPLDSETNRAIRNVRRAAKTKNKVDDIVESLTDDELDRLGVKKGEGYLSINEGEYVIKRVIKEVGDVPISFFDMLDDGDTINLAYATRRGSAYRGKGYGTKAASQAMRWLDKHPEVRKGRDVVWGVREDNVASIATAKKLGFELDESSRNDGWVNYVKRVK